jgi:hypothetical protein
MIVNDDRGEFYWKGLFLKRYTLTFILQANGNPEAPVPTADALTVL